MTEPRYTQEEIAEKKIPDLSSCPFHTERSNEKSKLNREDVIFFPNFKRVIAEYSINESGTKEFHIYYGQKEVCFDDPELFDFGEELAKHESFVAHEATAWGNGYQWTQIEDLIKQLIDEEILQQSNHDHSHPISPLIGLRPSRVPPAKSSIPRNWYDECETIT